MLKFSKITSKRFKVWYVQEQAKNSGDSGFAPGAFDYLWSVTDQNQLSQITLEEVTVTDITDNSAVTFTAGFSVSINGAAFTTSANTMNSGDKISVRLTSGVYDAVVTGAVIIGGVSCGVSVTSMSEILAAYWKRVDGTNILRTDGTPIEVFE